MAEDILYDVLYHPTYEHWLEGVRRFGPANCVRYDAYPVVSERGLTLADAQEFVRVNGAETPEAYTVRPAAES